MLSARDDQCLQVCNKHISTYNMQFSVLLEYNKAGSVEKSTIK